MIHPIPDPAPIKKPVSTRPYGWHLLIGNVPMYFTTVDGPEVADWLKQHPAARIEPVYTLEQLQEAMMEARQTVINELARNAVTEADSALAAAVTKLRNTPLKD